MDDLRDQVAAFLRGIGEAIEEMLIEEIGDFLEAQIRLAAGEKEEEQND